MHQATRARLWTVVLGLTCAGAVSAQPYTGGPQSGYGPPGYDSPPMGQQGYDSPPMRPRGYGRPEYGYGRSQGFEPSPSYGYCPPGCVPAPSATDRPQPPRRSMQPSAPSEPAPAAPMSREQYQSELDKRIKAVEEDFAQSRKAAEERMKEMEARQEAERKAYKERMEAMRKRQEEMLEQMRKEADEALERYPEPNKPAAPSSSGQSG
jgi:hypothetical protein